MICPTVFSQERLFILLFQNIPLYTVKHGSCFTASDVWLHHLVGWQHCFHWLAAFMSLLLILYTLSHKSSGEDIQISQTMLCYPVVLSHCGQINEQERFMAILNIYMNFVSMCCLICKISQKQTFLSSYFILLPVSQLVKRINKYYITISGYIMILFSTMVHFDCFWWLVTVQLLLNPKILFLKKCTNGVTLFHLFLKPVNF